MQSNIELVSINSLIKEVNNFDRNIIDNCLDKCGNPKTIKELFDGLYEKPCNIKDAFVITRYIHNEAIFAIILDFMRELRNCDLIIYGFEAITMIPHNFELEKKYVHIIAEIIENNERADVVYYGIKLFYKMTKINPIIRNYIRKECSLSLDEETIHILKRGLQNIKNMENSLKDMEYPMKQMFTFEDFISFAHLIKDFN